MGIGGLGLFEARFDAAQNIGEMGFGNLIEDLSSPTFRSEKAPVLHLAQMFRGHMTGDSAGLRQLTHRVLALEQHLHHPKTVGMGEGLQTLRRLGKAFHRNQFL